MSITHEEFFFVWKKVCLKNKNDKILKEKWYGKLTPYTKVILNNTNSIIHQVSKKFDNVHVVLEYYHIDAVFTEQKYVINGVPPNRTWGPRIGTWLSHINIAFEHENNVATAYQELSHLLTVNADLKVLVTYSDEKDCENYAEDFHGIVKTVECDESILLIFGYMMVDKDIPADIKWKAYLLKSRSATPKEIT